MVLRVWPVPRVEYVSLREWSDQRDICLVCTREAWQAVEPLLRLRVTSRLEVTGASLFHWETLAADAQGEVVLAVGGGLAVDAAKVVAVRRKRPLLCIPTALSVDAFFTWSSGYREDGCVRYIETCPPDVVYVDWDVIRKAPESIRLAGICDVLSIATGRWDWQYAHEHGRNTSGMEWLEWADRVASTLLTASLECARAAGQGDESAMKTLLDCLLLEVQLCNQIGHSRPEEGSEHYFAYSVENHMGKGLPHGDLVGPGILLAALAQGQDIAPLRNALEACHIPLGSIPVPVIETTLQTLPAYCNTHRFPYGIAHTLNDRLIDSVLGEWK